MIVVERHKHNGNKDFVRLCTLSKQLYNKANYYLRQAWFNNAKFLNITQLINKVKQLDCWKQFGNTKTSKQTIRMCLNDWSAFFKSLKAYNKNPILFKSQPKPPNYKKKLCQVIFYYETIKGGNSKNKKLDQLTANNDLFSIPYKRDNYKQVIITPKEFGFMIEVQYKIEAKKQNVKSEEICTIDLGINNLAAITLGQTTPILINGRIVKSFNQYYNKNQCKRTLEKRYFRIENYFHHISKLIINKCIENKINVIVIGKNNGWKQNINIGKKINQTFQYIPFNNLINKIKYKAEMEGIEVILTEESYTSQASFYDNDPLPKFGETKPKFSGTRKKRGLYVTKDGFAINADVNGSLNIGRKIFPKFHGIRDRGIAGMPVVVNPLKSFTLKVK